MTSRAAGTTLKVNFGKKTPGKLADAPQVEFSYRVAASSAEYLRQQAAR